MALRRKMPPIDVVQADVDAGMTDKEMAEKYGVSVETVRSYRHRNGVVRTRRRDPALPWSVKWEHSKSGSLFVKNLRNYGKRQRGVKLTPAENKSLDEFLEYLDGGNRWGVRMIVTYDPDDPDGFSIEPRADGEEGYARPA